MGRAGMFLSTLAIAAGAVMHWAVTTSGHGFNVSTVGIILMIVGAVGLVASGIVFAMSRRGVGSGKRTYDLQATGTEGQSTRVHEEVHG
ncbi:MAG: hypothetical protein ABSA31_09350 [Acidimicrobiales bacterium]